MNITMNITRAHLGRLLTFATLSLAACAGEGEIEVHVWGEEFIEEGIPADAFADGWAVRFDGFAVELRDVSVAGAALGDGTFDLSEASMGAGQLVGSASVGAGDYDDLSFTIARVEIAGSAEKGGATKTFAWTFDMATSYTRCEALTEVPGGGVGEVEVTIHADHLFYDSLVSEDPSLRFEAIAAADADADGEVTQAELEVASVGGYDPGNLEIDELWPFLVAQAQTMGHVDGEGHCVSAP